MLLTLGSGFLDQRWDVKRMKKIIESLGQNLKSFCLPWRFKAAPCSISGRLSFLALIHMLPFGTGTMYISHTQTLECPARLTLHSRHLDAYILCSNKSGRNWNGKWAMDGTERPGWAPNRLFHTPATLHSLNHVFLEKPKTFWRSLPFHNINFPIQLNIHSINGQVLKMENVDFQCS